MFKLLPGYNDPPMTKLAMQLPLHNWGSPSVFDWNGDGVPDLFHHNHFGTKKKRYRWSDPSVRGQKRGCLSDWDAVLRNGTDGSYYAANGGEGFIERKITVHVPKCFDMHSAAFLDIDGDGIKDLYCVTGGGHGIGNSSLYDNAIFWGEEDESSDLGYRLVGGREAAQDAGLHGRNLNGNERGRGQYWFDADGDGLIDLVTLNDERKDETPRPGKYYKNINGRKFRAKRIEGGSFAEYASKAILTDVDGDGFAKELVVPSNCRASSTHWNCKWRPRNSVSVYQYNKYRGELRRKTLTLDPPRGMSNSDYMKVSHGISTEDFDLDGKPDVAILWTKRVSFYLSSDRKKLCESITDKQQRTHCLLRMGNPSFNLDVTPLCGSRGAVSIRFADFNLNGRIDMLVVCEAPGRHGIYELVAKKTWRLLRTPQRNLMKYGALRSRYLMLRPPGICDGVPITNEPVSTDTKCTDFFSEEECAGLLYNALFAMCNLQNQNLVEAYPPTVADLDNDGYADIMLAHNYGSVVIMRNTLGDGGNKNRFLAVSVDKNAGAAASIGAIVKLQATRMGPYQNWTTHQLRVVSTLNHATDCAGGTEDRVIFGLGAAGRPKKLEVKWPHCCPSTVVYGNVLWRWVNSMDSPYAVPAPPQNCDRSCFN